MKLNSITLILENYLKRTNPFIRFIMVGIINTAIGLTIMLLFINVFRLSYWLSTFSGNCMGAVVSYFLNRTFTFQSSVNHQKAFYRFVLIICCCYFLSYTVGCMIAESVFGHFTSTPFNIESLAVIIGSGFYTLSNYFGQKLFVFKYSPVES
nr:GtrA family protein [uncultured Bacillus sp.]